VGVSDLSASACRAATRERIRKKFRPEATRLLLIGESPPEKGTFFYYSDSMLYRKTVAAFEQAGLFTLRSAPFIVTFRCQFPSN
jgi:hypothetical protein